MPIPPHPHKNCPTWKPLTFWSPSKVTFSCRFVAAMLAQPDLIRKSDSHKCWRSWIPITVADLRLALSCKSHPGRIPHHVWTNTLPSLGLASIGESHTLNQSPAYSIYSRESQARQTYE